MTTIVRIYNVPNSTKVFNPCTILPLYTRTYQKSKGKNFSTIGEKHVASEKKGNLL